MQTYTSSQWRSDMLYNVQALLGLIYQEFGGFRCQVSGKLYYREGRWTGELHNSAGERQDIYGLAKPDEVVTALSRAIQKERALPSKGVTLWPDRKV